MQANIQNLDTVSALLTIELISRSMIHQLKYQSVKEIAVVCARLMYMYGTIPRTELITSIPLHPVRLHQRGFNQAEEIGTELARLLQRPYVQTTRRTTHTQNLASTTTVEERKNIIKNQFAIVPSMASTINGRSILLIDDVWTTGSTLAAVATVLKQHGVAAVHGYTFAHGL
jgi:ComF family protein